MRTRHEYYELIEEQGLQPQCIIPITNTRSLAIRNIEKNVVVGIECYEGCRIEDRDVHFYKIKSEYVEVSDYEYEINYYFVYRKKRYYLRDLYEKKGEK